MDHYITYTLVLYVCFSASFLTWSRSLCVSGHGYDSVDDGEGGRVRQCVTAASHLLPNCTPPHLLRRRMALHGPCQAHPLLPKHRHHRPLSPLPFCRPSPLPLPPPLPPILILCRRQPCNERPRHRVRRQGLGLCLGCRVRRWLCRPQDWRGQGRDAHTPSRASSSIGPGRAWPVSSACTAIHRLPKAPASHWA